MTKCSISQNSASVIFISPPPAAWRGSGGLLDPGPLVCLSTFFYSATELQNYWAESNQTFYNERIFIEIVHLGIGFVVRLKLGSYDFVKNEEYQHNLEFTIPRPNSTTMGQNRKKPSTMNEYILKLCTWVLVSSCDQNWGSIRLGQK